MVEFDIYAIARYTFCISFIVIDCTYLLIYLSTNHAPFTLLFLRELRLQRSSMCRSGS